MPGIFGVQLYSDELKCSNICNYFYNNTQSNILNEQDSYNNFYFGRSVIKKFLDDRLLYENKNYIISFEGVCLNKKKSKLLDFILRNIEDKELKFLSELKGVFSGFIFHKESKDLFIFTDPLSTKPIYYYQSESLFIFASELKVISRFLLNSKINTRENVDAWRCILTFGYLLEDITPIQGVKKLMHGSYLHVNFHENSSKLYKYYNLPSHSQKELTDRELMENIYEKIVKATKLEWEKDDEYNYDHFGFLSGGLDSRLNVLLASKLGYKNINTLTFSQTGTLDYKISSAISKDECFNHTFLPLDNGSYLEKDLYQYVEANDGLVVLHGAAHLQHSISQFNFEKTGLGHSGQIGDVVFGSYYLEGTPHQNLRKACYNADLDIITKIGIYNELKSSNFYGDSTEIFLYKNRAMNGIFNGDRVANSFFDTASPFYDTEVIELGLSIPNYSKKNARFYRYLISEKFDFMSKYRWQQTGVPPYKGQLNEILSFIIRIKRFSQRKLGFTSDNMNPFNFWYTNNLLIRNNIEDTFKNNLKYIEDEDLRDDVVKTFNTSSVGNKLSAISVLLSKKLHFDV